LNVEILDGATENFKRLEGATEKTG